LSVAQQIKQAQEEPWELDVLCQQLYHRGSASTLWRVAVASKDDPKHSPGSPPGSLPEDKHRNVRGDSSSQDMLSA
jgi:hypothetical protein